MEVENGTPETIEQPDPQSPPPQAVKPAVGEEDKTSEKTFTHKEFHEELKRRMEREEKKRLEAEAKVRKDAEAQAAKERGEWEKVAKQQEATIAELQKQVAEMEAMRAEVERVNAALSEHLKAERKGLPEYVKLAMFSSYKSWSDQFANVIGGELFASFPFVTCKRLVSRVRGSWKVGCWPCSVTELVAILCDVCQLIHRR